MKEINSSCASSANTRITELLGNITKQSIIKLVFFLGSNKKQLFSKKQEILKELRYKCNYHGPVSFISQPPTNNSGFCVEIWKSDSQIEYKECKGVKYSVIANKEIVTESITPSQENLANACEEVFSTAEEILLSENMDFSNVVRQWNYIEDITGVRNNQQNYQVFNEARTKYYNKVNFPNGYPSATGIGIKHGLVNIELIATMETNTEPIENERQTPAYKYSEKVLYKSPNTPKFCRGKLNDNELFISGTASIVNQEVQHNGSAKKQTQETIKNLRTVIKNADKQFRKEPYFRVYVKYPEDESVVRHIITNEFKTENFLIVKADVCRPNLLVEIEGFLP